MNAKLVIANISRIFARIGSILVILLGIPFLLFVGLQVLSGETAGVAFYLYLGILAAMLTGLIIAWWREGLGVAIMVVLALAYFLLGGATLPGVGGGQGFGLLVGPVNLLFALLVPGYHTEASPLARMVPLISWILLVVPVLLFFVSWFLRKELRGLRSQSERNAGVETKEK